MRIATASAIAAFVLSLAATNAMAVNSGNSTNGPTATEGALGIDMSQVGTDAPSMKKYFSGLTSDQQAATMNHCNQPVTMTDNEKMFCQAIK